MNKKEEWFVAKERGNVFNGLTNEDLERFSRAMNCDIHPEEPKQLSFTEEEPSGWYCMKCEDNKKPSHI